MEKGLQVVVVAKDNTLVHIALVLALRGYFGSKLGSPRQEEGETPQDWKAGPTTPNSTLSTVESQSYPGREKEKWNIPDAVMLPPDLEHVGVLVLVFSQVTKSLTCFIPERVSILHPFCPHSGTSTLR